MMMAIIMVALEKDRKGKGVPLGRGLWRALMAECGLGAWDVAVRLNWLESVGEIHIERRTRRGPCIFRKGSNPLDCTEFAAWEIRKRLREVARLSGYSIVKPLRREQ
jgi:hypothetical protein